MERKLKVYTAAGKTKNVPEIRLQGDWLQESGFNIGDRISVTVEDGKITIEHSEEVEPMKIEEITLNERDTKKLIECLEIRNQGLPEKEKLTVQQYAEQLFKDSLDRWWTMMKA